MSRSITRGPTPFSAVVGQADMKTALLLNAVDPAIGGVLLRGERGTAKSTAVRALAELLPWVEVVEGCRFGCLADEPERMCAECRERAGGGALPRTRRRTRVIELPLNASEDRIVGSIDMEAAIRTGECHFEPGVLAQANNNILYMDEANLLDDHLVDVLLDAVATGVNIVGREGVSFSHPARCVLVGTMNPEEGDLRPQLLDRFGLCVEVSGLRTVAERVLILEHDGGAGRGARTAAGAVSSGAVTSDESLRAIVARARELLPLIEIPPAMRYLAAMISLDSGALGHRADIVIDRTARALRAWREAVAGAEQPQRGSIAGLVVTRDDVVTAAHLALAHRRRTALAAGVQAATSSGVGPTEERLEQLEREAQAAQVDDGMASPHSGAEVPAGADAVTGAGAPGSGAAEWVPEPGGGAAVSEQLDGYVFSVRKIALPRDRRQRDAPGKRTEVRSRDRRGRYVGSTQSERTTDVAFDATLRAAAPHQRRRRGEAGAGEAPRAGMPAVYVERQDLRQKVRRRRAGTLIVFAVDASASMDAEQRMRATKGAVMSLLRDAYIRRDKVALVVFSGRSARVVLQPTSSVDLAERRLAKLAVGGTTPLTHGLVAGLKLVRNERLRDSAVYPLLVLISDGRGNISLFGEEPVVEAQRLAEQIGSEGIHMLVIDSARDHIDPALPLVGRRSPAAGARAFNACRDLAARAGGEYLGLYDLSQGAIVDSVARSLTGRSRRAPAG